MRQGGVMKRMYRLTIILFVVVLLFSTNSEGLDWAACSQEIHSKSKNIREHEDTVLVEGRWKKTAGNMKRTVMPRINSTDIVCVRKEAICRETTAMLFTPADDPSNPMAFLAPLFLHYRIIDWSSDVIRAKLEFYVAEFELRISIKDRVAERSCRETIAQGSEAADPSDFESWVLE
jgi:hypothetical protein